MLNFMIQCHRWQIAIALLLLQLNFNVRHMWVHPINNLRFEKGEYFVLYPDLHKYEESSSTGIVCQQRNLIIC